MGSFVTIAPAAPNSASGMPDFVPASGSTAISAPSAFIFLTVSGVAATRLSFASISRVTAMRIHPPPRGAERPSSPVQPPEVSASAISETITMTVLGVRAPLTKPWKATMVATTKMANATSQCPVTAPIASPRTMLTTWAPPTTIQCTKRSYIATCAGRSLPSAVAYSTSPWSAICLLHACTFLFGRRGLAQLSPEGNGASEPAPRSPRRHHRGRADGLASPLGGRLVETDRRERRGLAIADAADCKVLDGFIEQPVEVELGAQMQKHRA